MAIEKPFPLPNGATATHHRIETIILERLKDGSLSVKASLRRYANAYIRAQEKAGGNTAPLDGVDIYFDAAPLRSFLLTEDHVGKTLEELLVAVAYGALKEHPDFVGAVDA